jgi:hypothetical protein
MRRTILKLTLCFLFYCLFSLQFLTSTCTSSFSSWWFQQHRLTYNLSLTFTPPIERPNLPLPFGILDLPRAHFPLQTANIRDMIEQKRNKVTHKVRCALVGSGGALLGTDKGDEIDAHEVVIR